MRSVLDGDQFLTPSPLQWRIELCRVAKPCPCAKLAASTEINFEQQSIIQCGVNKKRAYKRRHGSWEIILCHTCGSNGTHRLCSSIKCDQRWLCTACAVVADKSKKRRLELPIEGNCSGISVLFEPRPNRLALNRPPPDDTISISSDDSNDSSIQCITYINPPQPQVIQTPQIRLPVIASYTSMSTGSTRSRFHRRFPISASQSKSLTYVISDSIDLTTDDDDGANNT